MCLNSIFVVISFPKIIFEIEHYEYKSRMMHANEGVRADEWDQNSNFFYFEEGEGV